MMTQRALAADLMNRAICNTDHPGKAASTLLIAAGEILHAKFGTAGALKLMREILDHTEAVMVATHGQQDGEAAQ